MDVLEDDVMIQEVLGRSDFVGGIDNEALDFSQLEHFINDDNDDNHTYFGDTLTHNENESPSRHIPSVVVSVEAGGSATTAGCTQQLVTAAAAAASSPHAHQLVVAKSAPSTPNNATVGTTFSQSTTTVVVDGSTVYSHPSHNLPESPPDSGSEPPYSPQAHSPHQKVTPAPGLQDLLLQSPVASRQTSIGPTLFGKSPHAIHETAAVLVQHPTAAVLTPLLTQQQAAAAATATPTGGDALALAAVHEHQADGITTIYTCINGGAKKRKLSEDNVRVKQETELCNDDELSYQEGPGEGSMYLDSSNFQCIRFQPFQQTNWNTLCDQNLKELPVPHYRVDADKGFNFSNADDAFVCQKKNHFQITCHTQLQGDAQFVKTQDGLRKIASFHLHFYGVKVESPTQTIKVEQSQSDRSKKAFHPVLIDLHGEQLTKVTVGRLHFSETTSNNMRKKGKPNPDQRYFYLVVGLHAHCNDSNHYPIVSHASERIIVRAFLFQASNPGQFESDVELCWQRGSTPDSVYHAGKVGVNTDRPDEALVIHGNLKVTGHIVQPSDARAKTDIRECDTKEQLRNLQQLRVVKYKYDPAFSQHCGLETETDTGIIAQELQNILPEAVMPAGDILLPNGTKIDNFLVVNKERILMESVGAVKELCKVTDNLETRIDELERINRRLVKLKRFDSIKSVNSAYSSIAKSNVSKKVGKTKCTEKQVMRYNQLIQITIVILVLIMACCLLSMTTLYFMELQKRSRLDRPYYLKGSDHLKRAGVRFHSTTMAFFLDVNSDVKDNRTEIDGLRISLFPTPDRLPLGGKRMEADQEDGSSSADHILLPVNRGVMSACTPPTELSRKCQIFCCDQDSMKGNLHYNNDQYHISRAEMTPATNTIEDTREQIGIHRQSLVKQPESWLKTHHNKISGIRRNKREEEWLHIDSNLYPNSETFSETDVLSVMIIGSNFTCTLGAELCESGDVEYSTCTNLSPYNYSYVFPISRYLSESFVVRFLFPGSWRTQIVKPCPSAVTPVKCACSHQFPSPLADQSQSQLDDTEPQFTISLGDSHSVSLQYRVPLMETTETSNVCSLDENSLGIGFMEFNLFFYRDCDD